MSGKSDFEFSIAVCAGGTGGHLFPAEALSAELKRRGHRIILLTDERGLKFGEKFPCDEIAQISSSTLSPRAPLKALTGVFRIISGVFEAFKVLKNSRVCAVAGFGGYPTLPPMVAARLLGLPACLHEQNAVLGRANRFLARFATVLATSFKETKKAPEGTRLRILTTGNPVRQQVMDLRASPYKPAFGDEEFRLLIFGGSQGASIFGDTMPDALELLPEAIKKRLKITQQCRAEDIDKVTSAYNSFGIEAEIAGFFPNLPERIAASHLVVARSGASTLSELTIIGCPSILVPLPGSLDNDQLENARSLEAQGGAWVVEQAKFKPDQIAKMLETFMNEPDLLVAAAHAAHKNGKPDATVLLADAVEEIARSQEAKQ